MKLPLLLSFSAISLCLVTACFNKQPKDVFIPDAAPVLAGINFNEATVLGSAEDIENATALIVKAAKGTAHEAEAAEAGRTIVASITEIRESIKANPAANVEKLVKDLMAAITDLKKIIGTLQKENKELRDRVSSIWYWGLYGGAVFFTLAAPVTLFYGSAIPVVGHLAGPRIAGMFAILAATLYAMGYAREWVLDHEWVVGIGFGALFIAGGLAWGNHVRHKEEKVPTSV